MNSPPLPFLIASPPFLRRYIEPSSPRSTRYILFSPIITSFYFSPLPPPSPPCNYPSAFPPSFSVSPTRLRSTLPPPLSVSPFSLFPLFFFFFSFLTITHCFSLRLRATLSLALSFSLPLPSFSVVLCIFLLFFFYNTSLPSPAAASVSVVPISLSLSLPAQLHSVCCRRIIYMYICIRVRVCVCVCVAAKGKGGELPVDNRLLATGDDNVPAAQERGLPSPVCFPLLRRSRFFSSAFSFLSSAPFRLFTGPENPRGGTAYIKIKARPIKVAPNVLLSLLSSL